MISWLIELSAQTRRQLAGNVFHDRKFSACCSRCSGVPRTSSRYAAPSSGRTPGLFIAPDRHNRQFPPNQQADESSRFDWGHGKDPYPVHPAFRRQSENGTFSRFHVGYNTLHGRWRGPRHLLGVGGMGGMVVVNPYMRPAAQQDAGKQHSQRRTIYRPGQLRQSSQSGCPPERQRHPSAIHQALNFAAVIVIECDQAGPARGCSPPQNSNGGALTFQCSPC